MVYFAVAVSLLGTLLSLTRGIESIAVEKISSQPHWCEGFMWMMGHRPLERTWQQLEVMHAVGASRHMASIFFYIIFYTTQRRSTTLYASSVDPGPRMEDSTQKPCPGPSYCTCRSFSSGIKSYNASGYCPSHGNAQQQ